MTARTPQPRLPQTKAGGAPNIVRLAARQHGFLVTKRALWVAWVGLGDLPLRFGWNSAQGVPIPAAMRNLAGPQHFCHLRGVLRVGARNRAR